MYRGSPDDLVLSEFAYFYRKGTKRQESLVFPKSAQFPILSKRPESWKWPEERQGLSLPGRGVLTLWPYLVFGDPPDEPAWRFFFQVDTDRLGDRGLTCEQSVGFVVMAPTPSSWEPLLRPPWKHILKHSHDALDRGEPAHIYLPSSTLLPPSGELTLALELHWAWCSSKPGSSKNRVSASNT